MFRKRDECGRVAAAAAYNVDYYVDVEFLKVKVVFALILLVVPLSDVQSCCCLC